MAFKEGAVVMAVPVRDTIKAVSAGLRVQETPPRDSLWEVQTPQAFRVEIIREAYSRDAHKDIEATDDAMLVERLGQSVAVLEGHRTNLKITFSEDLVFAEALIREGRVGSCAFPP
jgi:2-C-methyl-D-erythritol 4-phosphate cytidylyltransferase